MASAAVSPTVSENPANFTPNVVDAVGGSNGTVLKYQQIGTTMYAAGRIGLVQDATRTVSYQRNNVFAFNATTGEVLPWAPVLDGPAEAMVASPDGLDRMLGGQFRQGQRPSHPWPGEVQRGQRSRGPEVLLHPGDRSTISPGLITTCSSAVPSAGDCARSARGPATSPSG